MRNNIMNDTFNDLEKSLKIFQYNDPINNYLELINSSAISKLVELSNSARI